MSEMIELYQSVADGSVLELQDVLKTLTEYQTFNAKHKDALSPLTSGISECLSRSSTRQRGLLILSSVLRSPSNVACDLIADHGPIWLGYCVASLRNRQDQALGYSVTGQLFEACSTIHELDRSAIGSFLGDVFNSLSDCKPPAYINALKCIEILLNNYSKASGAHKSACEKFLIRFLDGKEHRQVVIAAKCAHLLQQVRGGGEQGVNHKTSWRDQLDLYLEASATLLEELFSESLDSVPNFGGVEDNADEKSGEPSSAHVRGSQGPLRKLLKDICAIKESHDNSEGRDDDDNEQRDKEMDCKTFFKASSLATRLENLMVFIQAMLVEPYPVAKKFRVSAILELLLKCLSVQCLAGNAQHASLDSIISRSRAPGVQKAALDTLRALIVCLGGDILPFASLIMRMSLQTLQWTKGDQQSEGVKPFKSLRKAAYSVVICLLDTLHTLQLPAQDISSSEGCEDRLLNNIMDDIVRRRSAMQLTVKGSSIPVRQMSRKARRKLTVAQMEASSLIANHSSHPSTSASSKSGQSFEFLNSDLIISALKCLESLYKASGCFLKATTHKTVQEMLIRAIYSKDTVSNTMAAFYKTLLSVQSNGSSNQISIVGNCLDAFASGQNVNDIEVSSLCRSAVSICVSSLRGSAPAIHLATELNASYTETKSMSNSAVSKALRILATAKKGMMNGNASICPVSIDLSDDEDDDDEVSEIQDVQLTNGTSKKSPQTERESPRSKVTLLPSTRSGYTLLDSKTKIDTKPVIDPVPIDVDELSNDVVCMDPDETSQNSSEKRRNSDEADDDCNDGDEYRHKLKKFKGVFGKETSNEDIDSTHKSDIVDLNREKNCLNSVDADNSVQDDDQLVIDLDMDNREVNSVEDIPPVMNGHHESEEEILNDTYISLDGKDADKSDADGKGEVTIDEMLGSFVEEVVEEFK